MITSISLPFCYEQPKGTYASVLRQIFALMSEMVLLADRAVAFVALAPLVGVIDF